MDCTNIKTVIEESSEPLVFHNLLKWKLLDWDLCKWNECLGNTKLQFRLGYKTGSKEPQWEKTCEVVNGTFEDFQNFSEENKWLYFDYKYLNQWFIDKFDLRNEVNWEDFGYKNIKAEDSAIWIGSQGAHTPCHVDTYGFNLVAQLKGRKLWLLFPPEADLKATRIPYEESTVYSAINFYCPTETIASTRCKKIILEPGQVLFVPNGWWHYVENLELSISINTWIPIEKDDNKRVSEALTLMMMKVLTHGLKKEEQDVIINNANDLNEISTLDTLNLVEASIHNCKTSKTRSDQSNRDNTDNTSVGQVDKIPNLSNDELQTFFKHQRDRFSDNFYRESKNGVKNKANVCLVRKYLSVLTDPDVIALIEQKLSQAYE